VESGVILEAVGDRRYRVSVGARELVIRAATSPAADAELVPGARVVVNRTEKGRYIIAATKQLNFLTKQEVVIDG
jgi:hypothetical protein